MGAVSRTMPCRKQRRYRRLGVATGACMTSVMLEWTSVATTFSTIHASEAIPVNQITMEAERDSQHTPSTGESLLESMWQSFMHSLESTSSWSSSADSADGESDAKKKGNSQSYRDNGVSRRHLLMEQALRSHYMQQLVELASPFLDQYRSEVQSSMIEEEVEYSGMEKAEKPLRWDRIVDTGSRGKITCYFYSESISSFWCYQWCPQHRVYQGNLGKKMSVQIKHFLGSYQQIRQDGVDGEDKLSRHSPVSLSDLDSFSSGFIVELKHRFNAPGTTIELYQHGDRCCNPSCLASPRKRRIAAVILHHPSDPYAVDNCPKSMSTTLIESVEEHQVCQYVIHVCVLATDKESSANKNYDDDHHLTTQQQPDNESYPTITESKLNIINQTMQNIHETIHSYLYRGDSDRYIPDRTTSLRIGLPPVPPSRITNNLQLIRDMFSHAYDGYMYKAFPSSELKPITCKPGVFDLVQIPALTLIDSLDMLILLGNHTEFARSVERLRDLHNRMAESNKFLDQTMGLGGLFALNQNVSVFETNIRVLGGLLSGHQLGEAFLTPTSVPVSDVWSEDGHVWMGPIHRNSVVECSATESEMEGEKADIPIGEQCGTSSVLECNEAHDKQQKDACQNETVRYWSYDGFLLQLAHDIGSRLLPAFNTKTGIPYGTVNLISGIPKGETTIASLAGGGTLSLEMELLSRLSGDPSYGQAAKLSARALWMRRSSKNLLGKHLCTDRGEWTESLSGIGSNSDSYYEYLLKHHVLFPEDEDFWLQMVAAYGGIHNESRLGEWYSDVDMTYGSYTGANRRVFEALMAFYPGMQVLLGELTPAARSLNSFFMVREFLGFLPERFNFRFWKVDGLGGKHHLRPELLESAYFMHRATKGMHGRSRWSSGTTHQNGTSPHNSGWQWAADYALHALEEHTRTSCGYASIKELSPSTTGSIVSPTDQGQKKKARLLNEMPSFFLSETLKYLYLMFDENNALHNDHDREWIFTTEAHPIHYVPPSNQHDKREAKLAIMKEQVKELLQNRINGDKSTASSRWQSLSLEKWTEGSQLRNYVKRMEPVVQEVGEAHLAELQARSNRGKEAATNEVKTAQDFFADSSLVESFLTSEQVSVNDIFNDSPDGGNLAHLTFRKRGHQHRLKKACPNYYASDLLWIQALNGGANDYADIYLSTAFDEKGESNTQFRVLGALDALAIHGSGLHVLEYFDKASQCPLYDVPKHKETFSSQGTSKRAGGHRWAKNGKDRFDLGELGSFDVSAFPGGTGFFIQHVDTGETMVATLIDEAAVDKSDEVYVMVYSDGQAKEKTGSNKGTSSSSWRLSDSRWASLFKRTEQEPESSSAVEQKRSVVMADMLGNAFVCKVEIIHTAAPARDGADYRSADDGSARDKKDDTELVVAQFPCAPALFGPTHMSELVKTGGAVVEAIVHSPQVGDEHGCKKADTANDGTHTLRTVVDNRETAKPGFIADVVPADVRSEGGNMAIGGAMEEGTCRDVAVRLVRRGVCTFEDKATNQRDLYNAEAVIMINSEEEELFVMSGGNRDTTNSGADYPVTVLVTGADGEQIVSLIETAAKDDLLVITARVSLLKQDATFQESDNSFAVSGNDHWPAVRASSDALQIFAKGGWGVYAVQRDSKAEDGSLEWQLYLMQHGT